MQSENIIDTLNKSLASDSSNDIKNDFFERLQTYIDKQKWIKKPLSISPAVCSQYGWKCIKSDLLECVTCGAKLSALEPNIENFKTYKACIEKLRSDLKNNHGKHCPWPLTPSPENFVKMIVMPKEEALNHFVKHVKSALALRSSLPEIKDSTLLDLDLSEAQIISLCKLAEISNEDTSRFGKSLVSLATTGWILTEESKMGKPILKCNSCQRSVWSGLFKLLNSDDKETGNEDTSVKSDETSENVLKNGHCKQDSEEPPAKRKRISLMVKKGEPFDPLHEHRSWCLWIDKGIEEYSSTGTSDLDNSKKDCNVPGWKIFMKSLLRNVSDFQTLEQMSSPSKEQIRNVKSLLESWTDIA